MLLLWPGGVLAPEPSFGVPQLLLLAAAARNAGADVTVVDLDTERAFGPIDLSKFAAERYDVVGISCYSSFDYLKVMAIAEILRPHLPRAWFVTGGYHPSACPEDFLGENSPFDGVIVGDGERPLAALIARLMRGDSCPRGVLGPEPTSCLESLVPYDFGLLSRYRDVAHQRASQAELYLSRGCPHDCTFCMERAKRDVSWRALEPDAALEELRRLDAFLDLRGWTVRVADALFGMRREWRRAFLEDLARRPLRALRVWALIRLDLVERDDFALMARANVSPGFGFESGDPAQLARMQKSRRPLEYIDQMARVAEWAREHEVPFGVNVILGHPGETEASLRRSSEVLRRIFLGHSGGTYGFVSVDPFRLYPGSAVAEDLPAWQAATGFRAHRYPWWHDGDQAFLAEWVDPSAELDYRDVLALRRELFDPIVAEIPREFAYHGTSREYFVRAIERERALTEPRAYLRLFGLQHLWHGLTQGTKISERRRAVCMDAELELIARAARRTELERVTHGTSAIRAVLERVPRERFIPIEHIPHSALDRPLWADEEKRSVVSALHAYARSLELLDVRPGDTVVELGGGTGYGSALAAELTGPDGFVVCVEIHEELARLATENLGRRSTVVVIAVDAHRVERWQGALPQGRPLKLHSGFALRAVPEEWLALLGPHDLLVMPLEQQERQVLVRVERTAAGLVTTEHGSARYVADSSSPEPERSQHLRSRAISSADSAARDVEGALSPK